MGEASADARGGASGERTSAPATGSVRDALEVDLDPADVWVLGQLIEAGAASFPPEIEQEIIDGYRILKLSGYTPPPSRGHTNVELSAGTEERKAARAEADLEAAEASADAEAATGPDASLASEPETEIEDLPSPPPAAESETEPESDPDPVRLEDALGGVIGGRGVLEREVVVSEITTAPPEALVERALTEHAQQVAAELTRLGDKVDQAVAGTSQGTTAGSEPKGARLRETAVDVGLIGTSVAVAATFALAAAALTDAVFAMFSLGLIGVALFLAAPYIAGDEEVDT